MTQQTLRDSIEKTILICIKEAVAGEVADQDNCYDGATDIISAIKRAIPKKRKESNHERHALDSNYCYNCSEIISEEDERLYGNSLYNLAIDDFTKVCE